MNFLHWTERVPRFHELSGFGDIRTLNDMKGNSFEQSFMSGLRREIADRSDRKRFNLGGPDVIMDWTEVEAIVDEALESAQGFTQHLVDLLTADGVKQIAMATLKAEAAVINRLYPMSKGCVQHIIKQRDAEILELYGKE